MITAEQKELTITPDSSMVFWFWEEVLDDINSVRTKVTMPPKNANKFTLGNRDKPRRIPIIAPIADPPEIPRI